VKHEHLNIIVAFWLLMLEIGALIGFLIAKGLAYWARSY